ncbi:MAG: glycosyltransferase [Frankiales bacterium]|nr:glycosyltransferase [Frankiales bacterium]
MRVLHLSWEYPPLVYGGLGRHVHALAEAQAEAGHDVVVVTQHPGGEGVATDEVVRGVRVVRAPHDPPVVGMSDFLAWVVSLEHALTRRALALGEQWRPDVVHAHDWVVAHAAATLRQDWRVAVVATVHATEAGRHQGWLPSDLSRSIHTTEWWLTFEARRVITCSPAMREEVVRLFDLPPGKADLVPNGVDAARWRAPRREVARARATHAGDGPLLVTAGRVEWEKGGHVLLDAVPALRRRHRGLRVLVVGRGSQEEALREQARRLRLGRAVRFTGWLPADELAAVLGAADAVVVPSVYEPFGLVALEAMAAGTPLAAARTGGLADVVEDGVTGLLFEPLDARALATAVSALLDDDVRARRMARTARARVLAGNAWPDLAQRTVQVYRRAVVEERDLLGAPAAPALRMVVRDGNLLRDAT